MSNPGVVYTKSWVVDLILDLVGYTADSDLTMGCLVEPACGDGAFLRQAVARLCDSVLRLGHLDASRIEGRIRAYDVDPRSVASSRSAAVEVLIRYGVPREDAELLAKEWVLESDFILSDVPSARWVVGNPPYIKASLIPKEQRELYRAELTSVTMGSDLYVAFFEKALRALADDGRLCFICPDRWLQNRYGARLRAFMSSEYSLVAHVRMHGIDVFEDEVAAYPAVSLAQRGAGRPMRYVECFPGFSLEDVPSAKAWIMSSGTAGCTSDNFAGGILPPLRGSGSVPLAEPGTLKLLSYIDERFPSLEEAGVRLGIGIASGCDEVYITEDPELVESDRLLPLFFMRDWRSGVTARKYLVNPWTPDGKLVQLDEYPRMKSYLQKHIEKLRKRRVAKDHPEEWYRTLDKPNLSLLGKDMLLFPDMAARSDPVFSDGHLYPHHNCYWMTPGEWDAHSLGGLMMSDLVEGYVDAYGVKMRGSTLRFQAQYLRMVHIPYADEVDEDTKRELAEAFITGNRERANTASRRAYGLEEAHA